MIQTQAIIVSGFGFYDASVEASEGRAIDWDAQCSDPFDRFERLDIASQCAAVAVAKAGFRRINDESTALRTGIVFATRCGSVNADMRFAQTLKGVGGPSPLIFPHTLPSTPMVVCAMRFYLKGPGLCLVPAGNALICACWEAATMIDIGEADRVVCVCAEGGDSADRLAVLHQLDPGSTMPCYGAAIVLESRRTVPRDKQTMSGITLRRALADPTDSITAFRHKTGPDNGSFPEWLNEPKELADLACFRVDYSTQLKAWLVMEKSGVVRQSEQDVSDGTA